MWSDAGLPDVRARRMSLGGGVVVWGRGGNRWRTDDAADEPPGRRRFYALSPGGWRDYVTLLHPPYTIWHLSYVAMGAAVAS